MESKKRVALVRCAVLVRRRQIRRVFRIAREQAAISMRRSMLTQCEDLFLGTLAPFFRASDSPIAIACFLLFTLPPLPPFPERSVPLFSRCIALSTALPAAFPYLAMLAPPHPHFVPQNSALPAPTLGRSRAEFKPIAARLFISMERMLYPIVENGVGEFFA